MHWACFLAHVATLAPAPRTDDVPCGLNSSKEPSSALHVERSPRVKQRLLIMRGSVRQFMIDLRESIQCSDEEVALDGIEDGSLPTHNVTGYSIDVYNNVLFAT